MSDLDNDAEPHPAPARREPVRHPAGVRRRARQGHLDPPAAPAGHRPRRRRRDRGDRADGDVRHQGHELRRAAAACHPAVHGHRHERAVADLDADDGLEPARPRRQRPADRRSARRPRPGRRRHRAGPDQRGRGALDEGRHRPVETAGQTFGPYTSSHGIVRNPAATAVAWATDEGEVMAWADGESEPFVLSETRASTTCASARSRAPTAPGRRTSARSSSRATTWTPTAPRSSPSRSTGERGEVDPDGLLLSVRDATDDGRVLGLTEIDELEPSSCSAVLDPAETGSKPLWKTCDHALDTLLAERRLRARQRHLRRRHRRRHDRGVRRPRPASCWPTAGTPARAWSSTTAPSGRTRPTSCSPASRTASGRWSG